MNLYKTRMQIEESFRDVKNSRWDFSLNVLSTFYLGCRVIMKHDAPFGREDFQEALIALRQQFKAQCYA